MPAARGKVRATVRMPHLLYDGARQFVDCAVSPAKNINDVFVTAMCGYVKVLGRSQIDRSFVEMKEDADYQKEARLIAEEFSPSDWEAFEFAEREIP